MARLLFLTTLMLLLHFAFFVGYTTSDDSLYLFQAQQYISGNWAPPVNHWGFRYPVVLPTTLIGRLAGHNEHLLALTPLLYWAGILLLVYHFISTTVNKNTATIAGLLIVSLPLFVVQSTILGVDIAEAFFLSASFVSFYHAETSQTSNWRFYFLTGLLLGLAILTRETAYGFLLVLGVFFLLGGYRRWQYYLAGLLGVLTILSLESIYYLSFDHGIFYRIETIIQTHFHPENVRFVEESGNLTHNRLLEPIFALLANQEFALLFWAGFASVVYLWRKEDDDYKTLLRYIIISVVVYSLWIGYSGVIRPLPRYFSFPSILSVIVVAIAIANIPTHRPRYVLLSIVVFSNLAALSVENIYPRFASRAISEFALHNNTTMVTDPKTAHRAKGYLRLIGENKQLVTDELPENEKFTYALVDGRTTPSKIRNLLNQHQPIESIDPPKLLIGHILDISGIGSLLPADVYTYLAIRNPSIHLYHFN